MPKKSYTIEKTIKRKGFPTSSKFYKTAHEAADKVEKKRSPAEYRSMKNIDDRLKKNELAGKNTAKGKLIVSEKVPSKYRKDVALNHELIENRKIKELEKKAHKKNNR